MENKPYIRLSGITKTFGPVVANNNISLDVKKGEIHALLGENGSGKSTLMSILSGIYQPDSGAIFLGDKQMAFSSPKDAIDAGIGMVHQHFKLVDVLSAKENIIAGRKGSFFIGGKELTRQINAIAEKYGLSIDPDKKIYNMSVSEKQTVEIMKVLYRGADVLVLDEPTAVLTPQEIRVLFQILRNMKNEGCAVIIITHKLGEVMDISDRVTVLRKGESIKTVNTSETSIRELTEYMVGRPISLDLNCPQVTPEIKHTILEVKDLTVRNQVDHIDVLNKLTFSLSSGEILGVAGIAGSGQKALCEAITGLEKVSSGEMVFKGENLIGMSPKDIIRKGISMSFVPEDRLGMGLIGAMDITDNVLLKSYQNMPGAFINRKAGKAKAEEIIKQYDINTTGPSQIVKKLSGGNIQKVLLGREIALSPQLLITAYPVRGLDIGASYNIYDMLNEQKQKGVGILFIGEDLDILLELSDRIMVLHSGEIMDIVDPKTTTKEEIGMLMMGHKETKGEVQAS
ncbi:nucleoside ABC transporter ATP-binding protein [Hydrogenoanaerobacterium saccharovorans]|uniref:Nucleoside ABC transporter ATP-binding protein n=1 Tax=Hydrogenoanaerobacterium saccharovorans TaxID=474960 RepID=A0A1H8ADQ5_9FIRM|nr:ABC transporter ATP-binding protein [Hydrogenoanaerobacterium saccharovorans]RPF48039.1 nucleoside ABC transporter ATP-binding protein [Hydrogenoanaerobacterium saccharovorans]SEM68064.1 nucleoside ABC transporter ATP-binding protein [Hydrogenoanaerobacterium saccharovorans]